MESTQNGGRPFILWETQSKAMDFGFSENDRNILYESLTK